MSPATSLLRIAECYTRLGRPAEAGPHGSRPADPAPQSAIVSERQLATRPAHETRTADRSARS